MNIISPLEYFQSIKRYWRRRRYQRLENATRIPRKLKIVRLGNKKQHNLIKKTNAKQRVLLISPLVLVRKFHEAYVEGWEHLAGEKKKIGSFQAKKVAKDWRPVAVLLSASTNEVVDCKMLMEMHKRVVSMGDQSAAVVVS